LIRGALTETAAAQAANYQVGSGPGPP